MTITDTIQELLNDHCNQITIGKVPDQPDKIFVMAEVSVSRGGAGNVASARMQRVGESLPDVLNKLKDDVSCVSCLHIAPSGVVVPMRRNNKPV